MNPQSNNYSQYPPPPSQQTSYGYATNPYPVQHHQQQPPAYPQYPVPQQQQALPRLIQSQQTPYNRSFQPTPPHNQLQQPRQQRTAAPQYREQNNVRRQTESDANVPNGPGAPPAEDLEDQLRTALRSENEQGVGDGGGDYDERSNDDDEEAEDEEEPVFNLPPPPEGIYATEEELEEAVHSWSLQHGYELVRRASKKNAAGKVYKRYLHCSKYGKLANTGKLTDATRKRKARKTNRQNCPMSLAVVRTDPSGSSPRWQVRHRKTHHNHGPLEAVAMTGHRRRARMGGMEKAIDGLFQIGTPTAQVLTFLQRTNPDGLFTRTDVANMKLKFKKFGTCVTAGKSLAREASNRPFGGSTACLRCRTKKCRCDSGRPICGECRAQGVECQYDAETAIEANNLTNTLDDGSGDVDNTIMDNTGLGAEDSTGLPPERGGRRATQLAQNREAAQKILQDLRTFQTEHIKPKRLELNSSSVEILAQSSCGSGTSYKNVPTLASTKDWQAYSDAFLEASHKENTYETLLREKVEPVAPLPLEGEDETDVDEWNEHVKQLAIYNRRNGLLLGSLWSTLAPTLRVRIQSLKSAADAWQELEAICFPRGSDHAFTLYRTLMDTTLDTCAGDLQEYIGRLETAWFAFARVKRGQSAIAKDHPDRHRVGTVGMVAHEMMGEEHLCFVFLAGLGERFKRWVETLCLTSNVAGYGTGYRVGFRDLVKRAVEWEGTQRGGRGRG
ncbi:hypothetical protein LTR62_001250 [Meristemomyces frigidus]|uniref:Zn(2)-C6 fungal-type domain-containing protein n=1 Tax=Meristemomyces frigidus TaxID=1508187 RepID=A0AAN7YL67_9PEZI|nr:hypothetical protein LTR62_001250 [Meristemomyces frigidus]